MDDGEEIERTRHDYVQRVAHPLVAGVTRNTHPVMTPEAKAKAELWVPGPPAASDRAGRPRSYLVSGSLLHCATVLR